MKENNKLIAEFMGWKNNNGNYYLPDEIDFIKLIETTIESNWCEILEEQDTCRLEEMKFHSSWDWLMPVVEKCLTTHEVQEGKDWDYHYSQLHDDLWSINIETTYKAVVEFIKWYNENI